jgi:3D-(3,5/4)-trihydroxycyclohexane-1,2-dione acylhydrolase (decyclizing)
VVETIAGRANLLARPSAEHRPARRDRIDSANAIAAQADVVLAVGTRLQDFTTGIMDGICADAKLIA